MLQTPAIRLVDLTKKYGVATAVDGISLTVQSGEVFGLLGPNGSGKTTTILMMMGLTEVTAGTAEVLGMSPTRDPLAVKRQIGYMPDAVGFYENMTARQNLLYTGRLAGLEAGVLKQRIQGTLARVELTEVADRPVASFSRGMRQRLGLADALLKSPKLVILDEPTNGLDPHATHEFLGLIESLRKDRVTVLLSSHLLDRVQTICDRVALFNRGKIALVGTVPELAAKVLGSGYRIEVEAEGGRIADALATVDGARSVSANGTHHEVLAATDIRPDLVTAVSAAGGRLYRLGIRQMSLDEVYNAYFTEVDHAA
jgi:ABC-2 type transport system ATP-binding protein